MGRSSDKKVTDVKNVQWCEHSDSEDDGMDDLMKDYWDSDSDEEDFW